MKASPSKGEKERMDYCIIEMKGQEKNITSIRCFYFMDQKSIPSKKIEVKRVKRENKKGRVMRKYELLCVCVL